MTKEIPLREIVLSVLLSVIEENRCEPEVSHLSSDNDSRLSGKYLNSVLKDTLKKYQYLEKKDRAFISRLSEGTVEMLINIDYVINEFSKVKVKKMKPVIRTIIRMGTYQILFMDQVPDHAACNEGVLLATKKGFHNLKGFVNGVLRNISRNKDSIVYPAKDKDPIRYLQIKYSMPEWIVNQVVSQYDIDIAEKIFLSFLNQRPLAIRCNQIKTNVNTLKEELEKEDVVVDENTYLLYSVKISGYNYIPKLNAFQKGLFQVQDESSMLVCEVAGIKKDDLIIDVCGAPGGKSLHAAEKLAGTGKVISRDVSEDKVALIVENKNRLLVKNLEIQVFNALECDSEHIGKADIVFADVPCSGLGVLNKKPDIKYQMTREKQIELNKLQKSILSVVNQYVKPNGTLIYSTCTINKEENIDMVKWFVEEYGFELQSIEQYLPETISCNTAKEGYIQMLPGIHETDGFFIAKLKKLITT